MANSFKPKRQAQYIFNDDSIKLTGEQNFIWAAGAAAALSCLLTIIDAAVLVRMPRASGLK